VKYIINLYEKLVIVCSANISCYQMEILIGSMFLRHDNFCID